MRENMSFKENNKYKSDEVDLARFAKALGHPARVQILKLLSSQTSCFCGNLVDLLPLSQSTVSQHLKELKNSGLIQGTIEPPKIKYCINKENWKKAKKLFTALMEKNISQEC